MRFLFVARHPGTLRHLQSTIRLLGARGHESVVAFAEPQRASEAQRLLLERLEREAQGFSARAGVPPGAGGDGAVGAALRCWLDYLRYFEPDMKSAAKLRERAGKVVPDRLRAATDVAAKVPEFRQAFAVALGTLERTLPVPDAFARVVDEEQPDAVVACTLLEKASPQVNYLRAAAARGIPTAVMVASWDNLTTKGLIREAVDLVAVWNPAQLRELVELHRVPVESVAVTGASLYDEWFGRGPATSREEFCARAGLNPERPYLLYVCSSNFIAPDEAAWIRRWLSRVRGAGRPELENVQVLVRPHPQKPLDRLEDEAGARLPDGSGVAIFPRHGADVVDEASLAAYYDSIYHAAAVVGVNTSAMIESALVGRGVYVLLGKRYQATQEALPHFAHLRGAGGGLIHATADLGEHAAALARALTGEDRSEAGDRARAFLADFVRPNGLDQPATPLLVDALEALARRPRQPPELSPGLPAQWVERMDADLQPILVPEARAPGKAKRRS